MPIVRTNYVLVDFESVQPDSLAPLASEQFKVLVFVGASQTKVPFEVVASVQKLGDRAEYIKISGNGPNALDFHIAYYIGKLAATDSSAFFHIISKDAGFDPLIQHLKLKGICSRRVKAVADIPLLKVSAAKSSKERLQLVVSWLQKTNASKPRTVKTLSNAIASIFQKQLSSEDVASIVESLVAHGHLSVADTKVTYPAHAAAEPIVPPAALQPASPSSVRVNSNV